MVSSQAKLEINTNKKQTKTQPVNKKNTRAQLKNKKMRDKWEIFSPMVNLMS